MTDLTPEFLAQIRKDAEAAKGPYPWWVRGQHVHDMPPKEPHNWPSGPALLCCLADKTLAHRKPIEAAQHIANTNPRTTLALLDEIERLREEIVDRLRGAPDKKMFNYRTRLQVLAVLAKDAFEKKTSEAGERFLEALRQHQEIFDDRD